MSEELFNLLTEEEKPLALAARAYVEAMQKAMKRFSQEQIGGSWVTSMQPEDKREIAQIERALEEEIADSLGIKVDPHSTRSITSQIDNSKNWEEGEEFRRRYRFAIQSADEIWGTGSITRFGDRKPPIR